MIKFKTILKLVFLALLLNYSKLSAQDSNIHPKPKMHLITLYTENGVVLRWAPADADVWQTANVSGYVLQRAKVPSKASEFENYAYQNIGKNKFLPLPKESWASIANTDDYVAAAWTSIYEGRPEVTGDLATTLSHQEDIRQKSFFLAMLAADHSAAAAEALGLRYVDNTIEKGAQYIYRITISGDDHSEALSFIDSRQTPDIPKLNTPEAISEEKAVLIRWDVNSDYNAVTSYHVERAESVSGLYTRLTKTPYIHLNNTGPGDGNTPAFYKDSVGINYKPYYYRLVGITPFAIESLASDPVVGMGRDFTPPNNATKVTARANENNHVVISWSKPEMENDFAGYVVGRADSYEGPFDPVHSELLAFETTSFIHTSPDINGYNYYAVSVIDTAGNIAVSESAFAFFSDTIPPPPPVRLSGSIDTSGLVTIRWKAVDDPTLIGYRIYFSNSPDHTFIMRSGEVITDTFYTERIMLKTLSEKIWYRVASVDVGYGHSDFSEMLELKKPDIIPPTSGVFTGYQTERTAVSLMWVPSSSQDLASQQLWRKEDDGEWIILKSFGTHENSYTDKALELKKTYTYALRGIDDDGLISDFSSLLVVTTPDSEVLDPVKNLKAESDKSGTSVKLSWTYSTAKDFTFIIYRADTGGVPQSIDFVTGDTGTSDWTVQPATEYAYSVRVRDAAGNESALSSSVSVKTTQSSK